MHYESWRVWCCSGQKFCCKLHPLVVPLGCPLYFFFNESHNPCQGPNLPLLLFSFCSSLYKLFLDILNKSQQMRHVHKSQKSLPSIEFRLSQIKWLLLQCNNQIMLVHLQQSFFPVFDLQQFFPFDGLFFHILIDSLAFRHFLFHFMYFFLLLVVHFLAFFFQFVFFFFPLFVDDVYFFKVLFLQIWKFEQELEVFFDFCLEMSDFVASIGEVKSLFKAVLFLKFFLGFHSCFHFFRWYYLTWSARILITYIVGCIFKLVNSKRAANFQSDSCEAINPKMHMDITKSFALLTLMNKWPLHVCVNFIMHSIFRTGMLYSLWHVKGHMSTVLIYVQRGKSSLFLVDAIHMQEEWRTLLMRIDFKVSTAKRWNPNFHFFICLGLFLNLDQIRFTYHAERF